MTDPRDLNLILYVATYGDTAAAKDDYEGLKQLDHNERVEKFVEAIDKG